MVAVLFFSASISAQSVGELALSFSNSVGNQILYQDTTTYKNALGQTYTVTNFKYYISHIRLIDSAGKVYEHKDGVYLIDVYDTSKFRIKLKDVPFGPYVKIEFMVGVDSVHNCSGAQSGALDPINGMFWTWNSGYIFLKLEGKSPAAKNPGGIFEYHIGGYKEPTNFIRTVSLDLAKPKQPYKKYELSEIGISADVNMIFDGTVQVDISKLSSVTDFHNAATIADNYKKMFRVATQDSWQY